MNDTQLEIFIAVSDAGSFSKAEQTQYMTKQAMMKQVHSLENELSTTLFNRNKQGVTLTEEGRIFYDGAKQLLQQKEQLVLKLLKHTKQDVLRIGNVQHQVLLDPVTESFQAHWPAIRIQRIVHPNHSGEYRVENHIQDIAESFLSDQDIDHLPYHFEPLVESPYVAMMSPEHPLASSKTISLSELSQYPTTIFPLMIQKQIRNIIHSAYQKQPALLTCIDDVDHQVEIIFNCQNTNQIVIGANPFIHSVSDIRCIPITPTMTRTYGIIYAKEPSLITKTYIDFARKYYKSNQLPWEEQ